MKNFNKPLTLVFFIFLSAITLSSCIVTAVAVGDGTTSYLKGIYSMNIKGSSIDVYKAALKAVNDNNDYVLVSKNEISKDQHEIEGATKIDSTAFTVRIKKISDDVSKVTIKFGNFGDQAMSSTLMDQIQNNVNSASKPKKPYV